MTIGLTAGGEWGARYDGQYTSCVVIRAYLHVITLGWSPTGSQVAWATLAVLPGVFTHGARH